MISSVDADLEYITTVNGNIRPSEYVLSLHPSSLWLTASDPMGEISATIETIVIQGCAGRDDKYFCLSNLATLRYLRVGANAFSNCYNIVLDSMNSQCYQCRFERVAINLSWIGITVW